MIRRPRGRPRAFRAEEVLDKLLPVFRAHGFAGASLEDLTAAAGVAKPSLYAAFGDKRDLFLAAMTRYGETIGRAPLDRFLAASSPAEGVCAFLHAAVEMVTGKGDGPPGCLIAGAAAEAASTEPAVRERLAAMGCATEACLAGRLAAWGAEGHALPAEPAALAALLVTFIQGLAARARAGLDAAALRAQAETFAAVLGFRLSPAGLAG